MSAQEVIATKLKILSEYYKQLLLYKNVTINEYKDDWKIQRIIERTLHLAIECCIDIAGHIISNEGFREPADNKDLFIILEEENIITDKDLSANLIKMAQFRNIIVHDYAKIEPEIIIGILKNKLSDFEKFAKNIERYINPNNAVDL